VFSPRTHYNYLCSSCGRQTQVVFAADAEAPQGWECKFCGSEAMLLVDDAPVEADHSDVKTPRSHWDMLLERRTIPELEELLEERLQYLRARRGSQKIGA
jgi:DNA-directed RNA polymerase subunit RPC12/RpoP